MNNYNEKDLLIRISNCVKDHILNTMKERLSTLTGAIEVSHPTASKILNPGKENAGGVATKHWLATLGHCKMLNAFLSEIENKASAWHVPLEPRDEECPDEGLQRLTCVARSFISSHKLNVTSIATLLDVSHNTAKTMINYSDSTGGTAIKSWLKLLDIMEINKGLDKVFAQPTSDFTITREKTINYTRSIDSPGLQSVY